MIATRWTILAIGLALAGALGWTLRDNQPTADDADRIRQREFEVDRARVWQDRYEEAAAHTVDTVTVTREIVRADSIGIMILRTREALLLAKSQHDSLRLAIRWAVQADIRGEALQRALDEYKGVYLAAMYWKSLADSAAPVIQGLEAALERETKARTCKIVGLITCPSRKAALIVGAGGGLVLGLLLTR